jgi:hypothetical protein
MEESTFMNTFPKLVDHPHLGVAGTVATALLSGLYLLSQLAGFGRPAYGEGAPLVEAAPLVTPAGETATATATLPAETPTALPPTATPAATATATTTPTVPPTATPAGWDRFEPNDAFDQATTLAVGMLHRDLTLAPPGDLDYFRFFGKAGQLIRITTFPEPGTDTFLTLYSQNGEVLAELDDNQGHTSQGESYLLAVPEERWYVVQVRSAVPGFAGAYALSVMLELPTPTPTTAPPGPTATPVPTTPPAVPPDLAEPNNEIGSAHEIVAGSVLALSLPPGDVDWFRLFQKGDNRYQCTTNPSGVDTEMFVYDSQQALLGANDDMAPGQLGSRVAWRAAYTGWVYVLVRPVTGMGSYTLLCEIVVPASAPPGGGSGSPPAPPTATPWPAATPVSLDFRLVGQVEPTPAAQTITTVRLRLFEDLNGNGLPDAGEGIAGIPVLALYQAGTVRWQTTNRNGEVNLVIYGPVDRIAVPYLSAYSLAVAPGQTIDEPLLITAYAKPVIPVRLAREEK